MIPKIIHFCWISENASYPDIVVDCINSWKKILPDYEIKEWNQNNFDMNICSFVKEAYENKKYAFVSDYMRLYVLNKYGGIYLDTDVKVLKSFNTLLNNKAFIGFESKKVLATCLLATEKNNPIFEEMLLNYKNRHFIQSDGSLDLAF